MNGALMKVNTRPCVPNYAKGVTMVELMVAVVIGLLLVIGATTVYVNSRKTADVDETIARLHENARYALSVIEEDARMANYWGLTKDASAFANKIGQTGAANPSANLVTSTGAVACGNNFAIDVEKYVEGLNNSYSLGCAAQTGAVASADALTIRHAAIDIASADTNQLQVCSNRNSAEIVRGGTCAGELHNLTVDTYYIDRRSNQNSAYPSLRLKHLVSTAGGPAFKDEEVIPGVEDMQIQLGWDTTGLSGAATEYLNPGTAATGQVVAIRVWLMVRAETPDATFTDDRSYSYGDRDETANGTTSDLTVAAGAKKAYKPHDHFRRLLVSRTFFVRNSAGT